MHIVKNLAATATFIFMLYLVGLVLEKLFGLQGNVVETIMTLLITPFMYTTADRMLNE